MQGCISGSMGNEPVTLSEGLARLKSEHIPLLEKLHGLHSICSKIETEENTKDHFFQLKPAVELFIAELEPHSDREEEVLFNMMAAYIGKEMGPIAVMEYEHQQAKFLIGSFRSKTADANIKLDADTMKEYSRLINNAYHILVGHFSKEENILFPMAEKMLTAEEKIELARKIDLI
jgi:regulator of cell morphogenesis and NO signaling